MKSQQRKNKEGLYSNKCHLQESIELEQNSIKSRVGFYVSKTLRYVRRIGLQGQNSNLIIIDLDGVTKIRIINDYRSFAPQNGESQRSKFKYQLSLIKKAIDNAQNV